MKKETTLTTAQKWAPVDNILRMVATRKAAGQTPYHTGLDEYVDTQFGDDDETPAAS
jgi:hypothetical protein